MWLDLLIARWPQGSEISYMESQGSKCKGPSEQNAKAQLWNSCRITCIALYYKHVVRDARDGTQIPFINGDEC